MISELRFPSPGWRLFIRGIVLSLLGIGFVAAGLADLAFISWNWARALFILGGVFCTVLGLVICFLVWFSFGYGTLMIWHRWRQLRRPTAIIDADGIRYLAIRRPAQVPWEDIEEILLDRALMPGSVVTKVAVKFRPGAALVHDGPVKVPRTRYLNIGMMSDLGIPEDLAQQFLSDTAGRRLRITEVDRRTPSATHGYR